MKIQVNSDKTIAVDASLTRFVEGEVRRVLGRFAEKLTRVEVHLSDVDNRKTGQADKRCLIEVRPASARPVSASAKATSMASAVAEAAGKAQRLLTTFFGRRGRTAVSVSGRGSTAKRRVATNTAKATKQKTELKKTPGKKTAAKKTAEEPAELNPRGPKKKRIYQARRKAWPAR